MKKSLKITAVVFGITALTGIGALTGINKTGASGDWQTAVVNDASARIGKAGYDKKEEILASSNDVSEQMKAAMNPAIEEQEQQLARMLEEYYQMKIQGLQDTPEFKALEGEIQKIRNSVFERYKKEIDQKFTGI